MRSLLLILAAILGLASFSVQGAEPVPFTQQAFEAAQAAGKPIVVEVAASWCSICAKQGAILADLERSPELNDLTAFRVDFDHQKEALKVLQVRYQSTLIVFRGKAEKGRSTGVTDPVAIKALLMRAKSA